MPPSRPTPQKLNADLAALASELAGKLKPIAGKPYIVFHDAFQYLEARYDLNAVGSISISPDVPPSAKRLSDLRKKVVSLGAVCVFAEPQFDTRLVQNLVEGTSARTGTLDAEGLAPGAGARSLLRDDAPAGRRPEGLPRPAGLSRRRAPRPEMTKGGSMAALSFRFAADSNRLLRLRRLTFLTVPRPAGGLGLIVVIAAEQAAPPLLLATAPYFCQVTITLAPTDARG